MQRFATAERCPTRMPTHTPRKMSVPVTQDDQPWARESLDLDEARQVIASYALYREAVVEYLRTTRRELPPGIA